MAEKDENEEKVNVILKEKKLRGSGGYVIAKISDGEQKLGNLGGPELFLAGIGKIDKNRILKYYCNKCEKEYKDFPKLDYNNPNEDVGEGVILIEKGEYKCQICSGIIAQYRKFDSDNVIKKETNNIKIEVKKEKQNIESVEKLKNSVLTNNSYLPINSLMGMPVYNDEAMLVGNIFEIGLKKSDLGIININFKIKKSDDDNLEITEIIWEKISKIGDIVLVKTEQGKSDSNKCTSCNFENENNANYCEECGNKLK